MYLSSCHPTSHCDKEFHSLSLSLSLRLEAIVHQDLKLYLVFEFMCMDLKKYLDTLPAGKFMDPELVKVKYDKMITSYCVYHCFFLWSTFILKACFQNNKYPRHHFVHIFKYMYMCILEFCGQEIVVVIVHALYN